MKILVTGAAGFIGYYATKVLAARGDEVVGLDNINAYYDTRLKYARLAQNGISQDAIVEGQPTAALAIPTTDLQRILGNRRSATKIVRSGTVRPCVQPRRASGRSLLAQEPVRLRRQQRRRLRQPARMLPSSRYWPPGLCQFEQRIRPQQQGTILGG